MVKGISHLGNIENSRTTSQVARMQTTAAKGKCPLCNGNNFRKHNKVIWRGKYWRAWFNPFPYSGHSSHIVLATIAHITNFAELSPQAGLEWFMANQFLIKKYNLPGGGIVMRFGDNEYNAGTLFHCHSHIQVPDLTTFAIAVFYKDRDLGRFFANIAKRNKAA